MAYADDIAEWSTDREEIEEDIKRWNECFIRKGMKMNVEKTEILTVSRREEHEFSITIGNKGVKNTNIFKYLGSVITKEGGNKRDISERINKFSANVGALWPIIKEKHVPLEVKRIIFNTVLTPTLTYGSESWVMTKIDRSRIQAAKMRPLRAIVGKTRRHKLKNEDIRKSIGVGSMLCKIDAAQLRWLGHLERMDEERIARGCWEWMPDGRRPRGRPRKRWKENAEEALSRHDLPNIETLREEGAFHDRATWRNMLGPLTGITPTTGS